VDKPRVFRLEDVEKIVVLVGHHNCSAQQAIDYLDNLGEITQMHWEGAQTVGEYLAETSDDYQEPAPAWPPPPFQTETLDYGPSWGSIVGLGIFGIFVLVLILILL
jgi:hypothetical protein